MTDRELMQQSLQALEFLSCGDEIDEALIVALRQRLEQPERKPLTDKRITQVIDSMPNKFAGFMIDWDLYEFTRAIEAAHGIGDGQ